MKSVVIFLVLVLVFHSCKEQAKPIDLSKEVTPSIKTTVEKKKVDLKTKPLAPIDYDTTLWRELTEADSLIIDLRYATENNFTHSQIYPCGRCFLRPTIAARLLLINQELLKSKNWQLKLFDCYRPRPAQARLWEKHPNETHVTHPSKGSMHNRGAAVDLTIVYATGEELDMGTDFDSFDRKARHDNLSLPDKVLKNRSYLKSLMEAQGFKSIKSEWWHYSLSGQGSALSSWEWPCPE